MWFVALGIISSCHGYPYPFLSRQLCHSQRILASSAAMFIQRKLRGLRFSPTYECSWEKDVRRIWTRGQTVYRVNSFSLRPYCMSLTAALQLTSWPLTYQFHCHLVPRMNRPTKTKPPVGLSIIDSTFQILIFELLFHDRWSRALWNIRPLLLWWTSFCLLWVCQLASDTPKQQLEIRNYFLKVPPMTALTGKTPLVYKNPFATH